MSRRPPNPAAERAAQNQATIKSLLKLETNKICSDCKRNKHPRWASWNLGVFICIRCSGIHRGMGTHISRVKSVDLDSWTDEQLQSVLSWGNARANKYWEAKLTPGHAPSEAKIENFIRTKYELKRWVMDGPMPDPATLDAEADDDIPLSIVKEKQSIDRKESVRKASLGQSSAPASARRAPAPPSAQADLIGGDPIPARANSAGPAMSNVSSKGEPAPPKTTSTKDSLLGLDFLGTEPVAPPRPSSTTGTGGAGAQSRPDLKQSILSLYATAPRPQPQAQQGSFGGLNSPPMQQQQQQGGGGFGGMNDAFSSLSFNTTSSGPKSPPANDAFASLGGGISSSRSPPPQQSSNTSALSGLGGGSFFETKPAQSHQQNSSFGGSSGFGGLSSPAATSSAPPAKPAAAPMPASAALGDLFDFSAPALPSAPQPKAVPAPASNSAFNLSAANQPKSPPAVTSPPASNPMSSMGGSNWSNSEVWGASDAWSTPTAAPAAAAPAKSTLQSDSDAFGGWGSSSGGLSNQSIVPGSSGGFQPKVAADEEFGGWTSSTGTGTASGGTAKPAGGFGGNDDLFSNVWE